MLQRNLGIDALEKEHKVQDYDIVIVATDGLWDNLFDKDIEECITENMPLAKSLQFPEVREITDLQKLSTCLATKAQYLSYKDNYASPFAQEAKKHRINYPARGKTDDITVIAAQIMSD